MLCCYVVECAKSRGGPGSSVKAQLHNPNITNLKTKFDPLNSPLEVLRTGQDVHTTQKCSYVTSRMSILVVNMKDVEEHTYTHHPSHCVDFQ